MQTRAKWSRWGWGASEGYGLEIGETLRCSVVLKPGGGPGEPASYSASINSHILARHADREGAMRAVEKELESRMAGVQHDWVITKPVFEPFKRIKIDAMGTAHRRKAMAMRNRASLSAADGLWAELLYMAATYERIAEAAAPDSQAPGPKS